jgi:hypothetical protein
MAISEEVHARNRESLEAFLDNSTVLFFRSIQDFHGLNGLNGTPLAIMSTIATGEASYQGYFGYRDKRGNMLMFLLARPTQIEGMTFMRPLTVNGRGHAFRYVKLPKKLEYPHICAEPGEKRAWIEKNLPPESDIQISDKEQKYLLGVLQGIKRAEFRTLRKYTLQSRDTKKEDKKRIRRVFWGSMRRALNPLHVPFIPPLSGSRKELYVFRATTREGMALFYPFRRESEGPERIPVTSLDMAKLGDIGGLVDIEWYLPPREKDNSPSEDDWALWKVTVPVDNVILYNKPPFSGKEQRRYVKKRDRKDKE